MATANFMCQLEQAGGAQICRLDFFFNQIDIN